eukprot:GHUV01032238.1.p1 GENE.GHUV01032238.1~~GHUV01032238.1.p1  ORF type:complete len:136 (-),score=24.11 GHUV01032238.1:677-1084(-)
MAQPALASCCRHKPPQSALPHWPVIRTQQAARTPLALLLQMQDRTHMGQLRIALISLKHPISDAVSQQLTSSLLPGLLGGLSITGGSGGSAASMVPAKATATQSHTPLLQCLLLDFGLGHTSVPATAAAVSCQGV